MAVDSSRMVEALAVSINEAAQRLGIGRTLLYQFVHQGKIRAVKLNTRTLIPISEITRILSGEE